MDAKKANGLQDHDVGFPNNPVRRYKHLQSISKASLRNNGEHGWGDQSSQQQIQQKPQPVQQQMQQLQPQMQQVQPQMQQMHQHPYQPQQYQMQTQVPPQFMQGRPAMTPNMYHTMQDQNRAMTQGFTQQFMNMNYPQCQQNTAAQQQMDNPITNAQPETAVNQEIAKCNKKAGSVGDGLDVTKKEVKYFDPQASMLKQQQYEGLNWPFSNSQQPDPKQAYQAYQNNYAQQSHPHYNQMHQKPVSPFTNSRTNINQQAKFQKNENPGDVKQAGDFENNPHTMGQNPNHPYQPRYPGSPGRNEFQQPSYYMNMNQPQNYYQQYQQPQMQT